MVVHDLVPDHEFLVLACDGIWDVLTNQEVTDFIRARIAQKMDPEIVPIMDQKTVPKMCRNYAPSFHL